MFVLWYLKIYVLSYYDKKKLGWEYLAIYAFLAPLIDSRYTFGDGSIYELVHNGSCLHEIQI